MGKWEATRVVSGDSVQLCTVEHDLVVHRGLDIPLGAEVLAAIVVEIVLCSVNGHE